VGFAGGVFQQLIKPVGLSEEHLERKHGWNRVWETREKSINFLSRMDTDEHGWGKDFNSANESTNKRGLPGSLKELFTLSLSMFIRVHPWLN
jgi:hypothetical protein